MSESGCAYVPGWTVTQMLDCAQALAGPPPGFAKSPVMRPISASGTIRPDCSGSFGLRLCGLPAEAFLSACGPDAIRCAWQDTRRAAPRRAARTSRSFQQEMPLHESRCAPVPAPRAFPEGHSIGRCRQSAASPSSLARTPRPESSPTAAVPGERSPTSTCSRLPATLGCGADGAWQAKRARTHISDIRAARRFTLSCRLQHSVASCVR